MTNYQIQQHICQFTKAIFLCTTGAARGLDGWGGANSKFTVWKNSHVSDTLTPHRSAFSRLPGEGGEFGGRKRHMRIWGGGQAVMAPPITKKGGGPKCQMPPPHGMKWCKKINNTLKTLLPSTKLWTNSTKKKFPIFFFSKIKNKNLKIDWNVCTILFSQIERKKISGAPF